MLFSLLRIIAAASFVPLASLGVLVWSGELDPVPAALAGAAVVAGALVLAMVWTSDLRQLGDLLRLAAIGAKLQPPPPTRSAFTLSAEVLGEVAFVAQTLGARADEVDRLRRAEESIVERLPDPLIVLGPDRAIRRANEAARSAFGNELAAVLRHPDLRAAIDRVLGAGADGPPQEAEVSVPVPVPREVHATVTALASLVGFIDTLRGPAADDPPAQRRFLDIMAEQAGRMHRLIDDLLSLSRIELTEHQMPAESVDLADLLERMLAAFEIRIQQRGVTIDFAAHEGLPPVTADPDQIEQVVQNLLDNALKYGRQGGTVRVALEAAPQDGKYPARPGVVLSVADDGPGIAREHMPRLTERFYRVDAGRSRAIGGTGLGLAIVKHVLNRHRGQLLIESEAGQGATFSVWLPT